MAPVKDVQLLYRLLLRTARGLDNAIATRSRSVSAAQEMLRFAVPVPREWGVATAAAASVTPAWDLLRAQVRQVAGPDQSHPDIVADNLELGFRALRQAQRRTAQLLDQNWKPKPLAVTYNVGEAVAHRMRPYSGVIAGWDPEYNPAAAESVMDDIKKLRNGLQQPFYMVLIDSEEYHAYGRAAVMYVPQELLRPHTIDQPIANGLVHECFSEYVSHPAGGWYLPNDALRAQYPEDVCTPHPERQRRHPRIAHPVFRRPKRRSHIKVVTADSQ